MHLYLAAPIRSRHQAARLAESLRAHGHAIVSSWHDDPLSVGPDPECPRLRASIAGRCIEDLSEADGLIVRLHPRHQPRGTIFEAGFFSAMQVAMMSKGHRPRVLWLRTDEETEWPTLFDSVGWRMTTTESDEGEAVAQFIESTWLTPQKHEGA